VKDGIWRWRAELISALLFVLGGGVLTMLATLSVIDRLAPEFNVPHQLSALELVIIFPLFVVALILGLVLGGAVLILVWAPFSTTEQLQRFAEPKHSSILDNHEMGDPESGQMKEGQSPSFPTTRKRTAGCDDVRVVRRVMHRGIRQPHELRAPISLCHDGVSSNP
jgi:hypothetical protein